MSEGRAQAPLLAQDLLVGHRVDGVGEGEGWAAEESRGVMEQSRGAEKTLPGIRRGVLLMALSAWLYLAQEPAGAPTACHLIPPPQPFTALMHETHPCVITPWASAPPWAPEASSDAPLSRTCALGPLVHITPLFFHFSCTSRPLHVTCTRATLCRTGYCGNNGDLQG